MLEIPVQGRKWIPRMGAGRKPTGKYARRALAQPVAKPLTDRQTPKGMEARQANGHHESSVYRPISDMRERQLPGNQQHARCVSRRAEEK